MRLTGSVGRGGRNDGVDVGKVQTRLGGLGFYTGRVDGEAGPKTERSIQLFQSVISGRQTIAGDGRVDPGHRTHLWMDAANAPRWMLLTKRGAGFVNIERHDDRDHHDYGTSWLDEAIKRAGAEYEHYRAAHGASLMAINDASLKLGGNTRDHAGHETGLSIDTRLPVKGGALPAGGLTYLSAEYDRDAMRAQLKTLRPLCSKVFFNDPALIQEGLCVFVRGHANHVHAEILIPERCA